MNVSRAKGRNTEGVGDPCLRAAPRATVGDGGALFPRTP